MAQTKHDVECKGFPDSKEVAFAYPTSPNAEHFGYGKTGCYILSVWDDGKRYAISAHAAKEEAMKVAEECELPWNSTGK